MNDRRNGIFTLLAGAGIGAAIMYFLDPARGARRRHLLADQATSAARTGRETARDVAVDLGNRARGTAAELRGMARTAPVTDEQLVARVRSELGHRVERARGIEVVADGGTVTLRGAVPADELPQVVAAVRGVRGVDRVENQLDVAASP
ncbi:MAG TPA: BON domain-containing protein, partial [Gemmatimonadaceae bacterium]|nr:BON domain-containing protein [Gemmatimonadaceae bacterium]